MKQLHTRLSRRAQAGATMVEYGLMVTLIALAVAGTVYLLGLQIDTKFAEICERLGGTDCSAFVE